MMSDWKSNVTNKIPNVMHEKLETSPYIIHARDATRIMQLELRS